jgi:predicted O-methyltransferase YrrM
MRLPFPVPTTAGSPSVAELQVLYDLVRTSKPGLALEIGSLFLGSATVIAAAMADNGRGCLLTIDPFGDDRMATLLAALPPRLRERIQFLPLSSMEFFRLGKIGGRELNFAFIDGDHSYKGAHFDLYAVSEHLARDGILVMDNTDLSGVMLALDGFFHTHPTWAQSRYLNMAIIRAPQYLHISGFPWTTSMRLQPPLRSNRLIFDAAQDSPADARANMVFVARDPLFHFNGRRLLLERRSALGKVSKDQRILEFSPIEIPFVPTEANVTVELEVWCDSEGGLSLLSPPEFQLTT